MCLSVGSIATEVTVAWWVSWRPTCENCDGEEFHDFFLVKPGLAWLLMMIRWREHKIWVQPWVSIMEKFNMDDQEYWTWVQPWVSQTITAARTPSSALKSCWRTKTFHHTQRTSIWASFTSSPVARNWPLGERETQDIRWRWPRASFWAPSKIAVHQCIANGGHVKLKRQKLNCCVRWNLLGTFKDDNANGGHVNIIIKTVVSDETWADVLDDEGGAKGEDQMAS